DSVASVRKSVAGVLRTIDPDQPLLSVEDYSSFLPNALADWRTAIALLGGLAALAVLLTTLGGFAVVSYAVRQRTREIGIRMAIGATRGNVRNLILRQTAWLAAAGAAFGIAIAAFSTRLLGRLIYEVRPTDPLTFIFAAVILGAISLAASY